MKRDFDRHSYIAAAQLAITSVSGSGPIALIKSVDGRVLSVSLQEHAVENSPAYNDSIDDISPCKVMSIVPDRIIRITLEGVTHLGISAEVHVRDHAGIKVMRCGTGQALGFATSRKCPVFVRRSLLHTNAVTVMSKSGESLEWMEGLNWIKPARDRFIISDGLDETPINRIAGTIIRQALKSGVSNISIEPSDSNIVVKCLVGATWCVLLTFPIYIQAPLTARLKMMAEVDAGVKTEMQEGIIPVKHEDKRYDIMFRSVPSDGFERLEMKIEAA